MALKLDLKLKEKKIHLKNQLK